MLAQSRNSLAHQYSRSCSNLTLAAAIPSEKSYAAKKWGVITTCPLTLIKPTLLTNQGLTSENVRIAYRLEDGESLAQIAEALESSWLHQVLAIAINESVLPFGRLTLAAPSSQPLASMKRGSITQLPERSMYP